MIQAETIAGPHIRIIIPARTDTQRPTPGEIQHKPHPKFVLAARPQELVTKHHPKHIETVVTISEVIVINQAVNMKLVITIVVTANAALLFLSF